MSGNNYWTKVNLDILDSIGKEMDLDQKDGRFLEAVMLQFCLVETELKYLIMRKIEFYPNIERLSKYYAGEMTNFAALIDYLELLQEDGKIIDSLRAYNANRVEIVHKIMYFKSVEELQKKAKTTHDLGFTTMKLLVDAVNKEMAKRGQPSKEEMIKFASKNKLLIKCKTCNHILVSHIDVPSLQETDRKKTPVELTQKCVIQKCDCGKFVSN